MTAQSQQKPTTVDLTPWNHSTNKFLIGAPFGILGIFTLIETVLFVNNSIKSGKLNFDYWDSTHTKVLIAAGAIAVIAIFAALLSNKQARDFLKKHKEEVLPYVLFGTIAVIVAIGEAAVAGNFTKEIIETPPREFQLPGKLSHISAYCYLAVFIAAFVLSFILCFVSLRQLFYEDIPMTKKIIWNGKLEANEAKKEKSRTYGIAARIGMGAACILFVPFAALAISALDYNSTMKMGNGNPLITKFSVILWVAAFICYLAMFSTTFVATIKDAIDLYQDAEDALKSEKKQTNFIAVLTRAFNTKLKEKYEDWGLVGILTFFFLAIASSIISYYIFYDSVLGFSLVHFSSPAAYLITNLAMVVEFVFRWIGIWHSMNYMLKKDCREKITKETPGKKIILSFCLVFCILNGLGQGFGAFCTNSLPFSLKGGTHGVLLFIYGLSILLGSAGLNLHSSVSFFVKDKESEHSQTNTRTA